MLNVIIIIIIIIIITLANTNCFNIFYMYS